MRTRLNIKCNFLSRIMSANLKKEVKCKRNCSIPLSLVTTAVYYFLPALHVNTNFSVYWLRCSNKVVKCFGNSVPSVDHQLRV
jgi:hypothetical protein